MPTLYDAIKAGVAEALRGLCIGMPGRLESYDSSTGRGEVKPLIQEPNHQGVLQAIKPIRGVPVVMMGGNTASLYLPPEVGDTGWLSFSHRSMENWLTRGGDAAPGDPRMMDMSDAVFWPGLRPFNAGSLAEEADAAFIKNGRAKVKIRGNRIAIGNDVGELLDLVSQLMTELISQPTVLVNIANGIGGLNPATVLSIGALKLKLDAIKGSL